MNNIKFRAWDISKKVMYMEAEGAYDYTCMYTNSDQIPAACFKSLLENDQYIVMQFTGLQDKNGVDIYHNDLINIFYTHNGSNFDGVYRVNCSPIYGTSFKFVRLLWEDNGWNQFPITQDIGSRYFLFNGRRIALNHYDRFDRSGNIEVMGNIHEDLHLLNEITELLGD